MNGKKMNTLALYQISKQYVLLGFFLIVAVFFLLFFNDLIGYEGVLGLLLLTVVFFKFRFFKNVSMKFSSVELIWFSAVFFYGVMILVSTIFHQESWAAGGEMLSKYSKILYLIPFVYMMKYILFDIRMYEKLVILLAYLIIFMVLIELYLVGPGYYLGSLFSEKGAAAWFFSAVLISTGFFAVFKYIEGAKAESIHLIFLSLLLITIILFTSTRSIWLSLAIAFLVLTPLLWRCFSLPLKRIIVMFGLIALVFSLVLLNTDNKVSQELNHAVSDIQKMSSGDYYSSLGLRVVMYETALEGIVKAPWMGLGEVNYQKNNQYLLERYEGTEKEQIYQTISTFKQIHNQFLMDMWMKGALGFISLILIFVVPWYAFRKCVDKEASNPLAYIGFAYLVVSFVFFQFGAVLTYSHGLVFFLFWITLVLMAMVQSTERVEVE